MELDIWQIVVAALKRLPPTCKPKQLYTTAQVLAVLLWAALHDRSILWACRRRSWPVQAWRRRLPDQSTMSRRLHDPALLEGLTRVLDIIQRAFDDGDNSLLRIDGKPPSVCNSSPTRWSWATPSYNTNALHKVARWQRNERAAIEHFFGGLSSAGGLYALPPWTRTLGRVRVWVYAKVALNAARIARTQARAA